MKFQQTLHVIVNGTETANSAPFSLESAEKVSFVFQRSNHASGTSAFKLQISVDGTNWVDYNKLISDVANSNVQDVTRVTTITLDANELDTATMDYPDTYPLGRIVSTITTDGTSNAWVTIQY